MTASSAAQDSLPPSAQAYDVEAIRADFPILARAVYDKPLVFLDSAASAQKPRVVIDAVRRAYEEDYANVHRGAYLLSARMTEAYEEARRTVARFLNAPGDDHIVFTTNATDAINLVAASWGGAFLAPGDEIVLTEMEHHANIVPWQLLQKRTGCVLKVVPVDDSGHFLFDAFEKLVGERTRLVAVTHTSNVLGTVTPLKRIIDLAHARGALVLGDGSQAVVHGVVDVQDLDVDFYVMTGHKLYGPSGIGVLYGKKALLDSMPPYRGGGEMIRCVSFEETTFREAPLRFEAGTPPIVQAVGLKVALDYMQQVGREAIARHEQELLRYATGLLSEIEGLRIFGQAQQKAPLISFALEGIHPADIAAILDRCGVAVRAGHHCAEPLMQRFGVPGTVRASFGMYNTFAECDALAAAIRKAKDMCG